MIVCVFLFTDTKNLDVNDVAQVICSPNIVLSSMVTLSRMVITKELDTPAVLEKK
jgi:hypothetical protein